MQEQGYIRIEPGYFEVYSPSQREQFEQDKSQNLDKPFLWLSEPVLTMTTTTREIEEMFKKQSGDKLE